MNPKKFAVLVLALSGFVLRADEQLPLLKVDNEVYSNATVFKVTATDIYFTSAQGMGNAKLKDLAPALQKHFHYDPAKAAQAEKKQAAANAQYHSQAINQAPSSASESSWGVDLPTALKQARAEKKLVLLDFTGSDWCVWCRKFDGEVLSTAQFANYANRKLALVEVDFPDYKPQSNALKQDNQALKQKYGINGFPTFVLLDANGNELGRQVGYRSGGPDAFITELERFAKK